MEQRLINANDLWRYSVVKEDGSRYVPWLAIAEVQTADVVRHARWVEHNPVHYRCSACDFGMGGVVFRYCSSCGAKMDGGDPDAEK